MNTNEPFIIAPSMLVAQSVKLDAESLAWLKARAARRRAARGTTGKVTLTIPVVTDAGTPIGSMAYRR